MNKKFFIVGSLLLGVAATAWYIKNQIDLIGKVKFAIKGYILRKLTFQTTVIGLKVAVENKGAMELRVRGYDFNVYGDGNYLARVVSNQQFTISPYGVSNVEVDVVIDPKLLLKGLGKIIVNISDWKNIHLKLDGGIKITKGGIPFKVPFKYGFKLNQFIQG